MNPTIPPIPVMPNPTPVVQPAPPTSNKKMWLIGGGVLAIIVLLLIIWMMAGQKKVTPTPAPRERVEDTLEKELNSVSVEDIEADFQSVDQDLQDL